MSRCNLSYLLFTCLAFSLGAAAAKADGLSPFEKECAKLERKTTGTPHDRLWKIFGAQWDYFMREYPEWATQVGYAPHQNDRWTDFSLEAVARRKREDQAPLKALATIPREKLSPADRDNYDLFKYNLQDNRDGDAFPYEFLAISQLDGVQQSVPDILEQSPQASVTDYEDRISRLRKVPALIDQQIALLKEGLKRGITPPRITLRDVPDQVKAVEETDPAKSPLLASFRDIPETFPADERKRLRDDATRVVITDVVPAFTRLREFLVATYLPGAREAIGWDALPNGKAWYAFRIRRETTTRFSAEELHALGLSEVARIRAEMEQVIRSTGFHGDFAKFTDFLRTDSQFYFENDADLLTRYRDIAKRIDPELPRLFGKLPRLTYGVKPVPAYAQKSQTTAYYEPGSLPAGRAGTFFANTYNLKARPKWEMEALTAHEAVPGHHLQIALAQEMEDAPEFRKQWSYTAFVEGWGLYAESLGTEIGLYRDPYSKFGQLTYEMWRAIRLVLDTGIHAKGWTRDQALDFFRKNTGKTEHDITVEVDRYIVWAGQALAYKAGELKIKSLRAQAQTALGEHFDVRAFHDVVLGHGAVPLDVLEANVHAWLKSAQHN